MNKLTIGIVGVLTMVVLVLGVAYFNRQEGMSVNTRELEDNIVRRLGAVSGNEFQQDHIIVNGEKLFAKSQSLVSGTSTPCTLRSPMATATLVAGGISIMGQATTSPWNITIGRTNILNPAAAIVPATTTLFASSTLDVGARGTFSAMASTTNFLKLDPAMNGTTGGTTTVAQAEADRIFPPNNLLVFRILDQIGTGFSANGSSATGTCMALWAQI